MRLALNHLAELGGRTLYSKPKCTACIHSVEVMVGLKEVLSVRGRCKVVPLVRYGLRSPGLSADDVSYRPSQKSDS
jgi:hypothetical protein